MIRSEPFREILHDFIEEFFSPVADEECWHSESADSSLEECPCQGCCFLLEDWDKFGILREGIRNHEYDLVFFSGVPQRLDAGDLGRPTRYCYLESIYHAWDGGTDHRASLVSHPTQCVAVLGGLH